MSLSSVRFKKKSEQEHEEGWLYRHGHTFLLINVENDDATRITAHDELNTTFLRGELFWKITVHGFK